MIKHEEIRGVIGRSVMSSIDGERLGKAGQVFLDDETDQPEWVTVQTGLFGTKETFVPLIEARLANDGITVPYTKNQIKDAPRVAADEGHLDRREEEALYAHYGLHTAASRRDTRRGLVADATDTDRDEQDASRGRSGEAITRSEEQLRADTERVPAGKARLRKYVETEQQQVSVPVSKEKVRLETEPITDANEDAAMSGPAFSEEEHEVTLTEERAVVAKEAVPVERVRLETDVEQTEETVTADVRKEQIDTEGDIDLTRTEQTRRR